jgi:2-dehydro-3-deoxyphosphooctonate aldolase (KDO 8-P synthase)
MKNIKINNFEISNHNPFTLIVGPCVIESHDHALTIAENIKNICEETNTNFIFKASFDKANRSNINSVRGVGLREAEGIFAEIKNNFECPILTDVHNEFHCKEISNWDNLIDVIQIPAFLCRQTDLLLAAGNTKKIINVKKGQFLSPMDIPNIIEKIKSTTNENILITERGTFFGYNNLVSDFRSLEIIKKTEYPVIFDATHSVQEPGGLGESSGGKREFVPVLAKAAISVGIAGLFIEVHDDPDNAPSDGPNMLHLKDLKELILKLKDFDNVAKL